METRPKTIFCDIDGTLIEHAVPWESSLPTYEMKILSGTRFQWIAYNTETMEFSGTGGGRYAADNGTYTEMIQFFSRDDSRVGAELSFQFERQGNDWHHTDSNSRGEPMYEIWAIRQ